MLTDPLKNRIISDDMENIWNFYASWEDINKKSVYVTGATGMIASYVVFFLIYLNEIKGLDVKIYACVRNKEKAYERFGIYIDKDYFELVETDVCKEVPYNIRFDYIIHAASLASPQYYGSIPVDVMTPNVIGTYYLLEHARKHGCESFLFFSSGSVYGSLDIAGSIIEENYGIMDYLAPGNCYGESKRCGEAIAKAYFDQYGVHTNAVRIFHTYGPTMDIHNDKRVFAEFVKNVINGEDIIMKSDGAATRPFCYLTDTVTGILCVLLHGEAGACYNIGNPKEYMAIRALAELMTELSGDKPVKVRIEKREADDVYQPSPERKKAVLDIRRMQRLGWNPKIGAREGFDRCIKYFKML